MDALLAFLAWFSANADALAGLAIVLATVAKLTAWGRANKAALDGVVAAIETARPKEGRVVKARVRGEALGLSPAARDALEDAVARADVQKPTPSPARVVLREARRLPRRRR